MKAYSSYIVTFSGNENDIIAASSLLAVRFRDPGMRGSRVIEISERIEAGYLDEMRELLKNMARVAPNVRFIIEGLVGADRHRDFSVEYADGHFIYRQSGVYKELFAEDYDEGTAPDKAGPLLNSDGRAFILSNGEVVDRVDLKPVENQ